MVEKAEEAKRRRAKRKQLASSFRVNLQLSNDNELGSVISVALSQYELNQKRKRQMKKRQLHGDLFGILATIFMQDGPFLALRLVLITMYNVSSEMQFFFAGKNAVSIALLLYRLFVLQCKKDEDRKTPYQKFRKVSLALIASARIAGSTNSKTELHA